MLTERVLDLTDEQWELVRPLIPQPVRRADRRGRPWRDSRAVLNGVLWILQTGSTWRQLPARFPPYQTCHRRFQQWTRAGVLDQVLAALRNSLSQPAALEQAPAGLPVGNEQRAICLPAELALAPICLPDALVITDNALSV